MVKGFDPTTSDPSKIVLQYLIRWTASENPLSMHEAERFIKYWLKNSSYTSELYKKFKDEKLEVLPSIKLKKKCHQNYLNMLFKQPIFDKRFPAYHIYKQQNNNKNKQKQNGEIVLCLNYITNKTQLKENLDREMTVLYEQAKVKHHQKLKQLNENNSKNKFSITQISTSKEQEKDIQLMTALFRGCQSGYKNYMLQKGIQQGLAKKCAKYLFFRRTQRKLPQDSLFRYTTKIAQQLN